MAIPRATALTIVGGLVGASAAGDLALMGCGDDTVRVTGDSGSDGMPEGASDSTGDVRPDTGSDTGVSDGADAARAHDAADASDAAVAMDAVYASDSDASPLLEFPDAYATALCTGLSNCCGAGFDLNLCKNANRAQGYDNQLPFVPAAIAAGHLTFNQTQAAACTTALQSWPCGTTITSAQNQAILSACHNVFVGTIPVGGGGCLSSFECVAGAYCHGGTCTALVADGGACEAGPEAPDEQCMNIATAQPGLFCNLYPSDGGASSGAGTCQPPQADGTMSRCSDGVMYASDFACANQLCSAATNTCAASMTNPADPAAGYYCSNYKDAGGGG